MLRFVEHQVGVFRSLDVDVGAQRLDGRERSRLGHQRDIVDDFEGRHLHRPVRLVEGHRALLGDVAVGGDRHDEDVAERFRFFEMQDVADVHEVEGAVALHDRAAAQAFAEAGQIVEGDNLFALSNARGRQVSHGEAAPVDRARGRP